LTTLLLTLFLMFLSTEICLDTTLAAGESTVSRGSGDQSDTLVIQPPGTIGPSIGSVQWTAAFRECGWPFPIYRLPLPVIANWTLDDPPETVNSRVVPEGHPLAGALREELDGRSLPSWYMASLEGDWSGSHGGHLLWWNALFTLGLIWLLLYALVRIPMAFLRAGLILKRGLDNQVEARRSNAKRCIQCGYNLSGLDMAERCPECGTMLW